MPLSHRLTLGGNSRSREAVERKHSELVERPDADRALYDSASLDQLCPKFSMRTAKIRNPEPLRLDDSVIFEGSALNVLQRLPSSSVQCVVTSPPYWGLRDYNIADQIGLEQTLPQFIHRLQAVFAEVRRVLKDDGVLWLNIGDGYTSGNRGWRAPDKKNPARAMAVRPDTPEGLKPKDLMGIPWRLAFALQDDGWYLRADIVWNKPNAMPESVKDRPTRAHEYVFMFSKSERYLYDREAVLEPNGRNCRSVWNINTQAFAGAHFATFPPKLVEPCIRASTRPGDLVLDPFFGAGTVGLVAQQAGRRYVGIELNPEYVSLAVERLSADESSVVRVAA
ncbi:site-specific DNA-methyltransferase [Burkholderia glumae]|uniref:DNA-methyltransferase n=2 Tax=Burkholderiaceae TaxID=119060 RepID=UPI001E3DA1BA|nr:site-specific DNA-methyltransferase [Burkholderia glumae]MCM2540381.1 site-specific DNA-methyltransferase [Burkholderia glumae]